MVDADTGSYTYLLAGTFGAFGYAHHPFFVGVYADGAVIGLHTGGKGCSACRRVGDRVGCRESGGHTCHGEGSETEGLGADASLLFAQIHFGSVHLVQAHAVANEIEYILCLLCFCHQGHQQEEHQIRQSFHNYDIMVNNTSKGRYFRPTFTPLFR